MTETGTDENGDIIPGDVARLLEKRSTLRDWLDRLGEREDDVRDEVYARVRDDYRERLSGVERELAGHRTALEKTLEERRRVLEDAEEQREERAALLEEVQLRHEVGELTDGEWEESRDEHEEALDELDARLEGERDAVDRLEEVVAELREIPEADPVEPAADGESGPRRASASGGDGRVARATPVSPTGEEEPATGGAGHADEDPAADAASPKGGAGATSDGPGATAPAGSADEEEAGDDGAEADEAGDDYEDELDFLESLSLDDAEGLDTLSLVLDDEEDEGEEDDDSARSGGGGNG